VLDALTDDVRAALEVHVGDGVTGRADEHLTERGHRGAGQRTERGVVGGDRAPAENRQALLGDDLLDARGGLVGSLVALRQERDTGGVRARGGQLEVDDGTQEAIRHLEQDAGAVTRVGLGARGAAVLEVDQRGDRLLDDVPTTTTVHVDDERDATRVVLVRRVVEPLGPGKMLHTYCLRMRRCTDDQQR